MQEYKGIFSSTSYYMSVSIYSSVDFSENFTGSLPTMKTKTLTIEEVFEIPNMVDKAYEFTEHISEQAEVIKELLTDNQHYNFIAGMNSGKTYGLLKLAHQYGIKMIMVLPLQMIVIQKQSELLEKEYIQIGKIHGNTDRDAKDETTREEIAEYIRNCTVIACVYDSLWKLFENPEFDAHDYVLCVDEAHNLVSQYNFRYQAINNIITYKEKFKKVIYMTGTPEGTLMNEQKFIRFTSLKKTPEIRMNIIRYKKDIFDHFCYFIRGWRGKGKVVVLVNSKQKLDNLKQILINSKIPENEIMKLSSDDKRNAEFIQFCKEEGIPQEKRYLLTTSVIADGVNIHNTDIEAIFIYNITDLLLKRQFIARFREVKSLDVYDFLPEMKIGELKLRSVYDQVNERLNSCKKVLEIEKEFLYRDVSRNPGNRNFQFWIDQWGKLRISGQQILHLALVDVNEQILVNLRRVTDYYQSICKYITGSLTVTKLRKKLKIEKSFDRVEMRELLALGYRPLAELPEYLKENVGKIIYAQIYNEQPDLLREYRVTDLIHSFRSFHPITFQEENEFIFNRYKAPVNFLFHLFVNGYSKRFLEELCILYLRNDKCTKLMYEMIERHLQIQFMLKNPEFREIVNRYDAFRDYRMSDLLLSLMEINETFIKAKDANIILNDFCLRNKIVYSTKLLASQIKLTFNISDKRVYDGRSNSRSYNISKGFLSTQDIYSKFGIQLEIQDHEKVMAIRLEPIFSALDLPFSSFDPDISNLMFKFSGLITQNDDELHLARRYEEEMDRREYALHEYEAI